MVNLFFYRKFKISMPFKIFNESCSLSKAAKIISVSWIKVRFVKIVFIKPLRFVKPHENISKNRSQRSTHGYSISLIIKFTFKNKMIPWCNKKEKFFKLFFSDSQIKIVIENEIYCYINGSLNSSISKKTSYIVWNKKHFEKIFILNLRNKRKRVFARVIIRY